MATKTLLTRAFLLLVMFGVLACKRHMTNIGEEKLKTVRAFIRHVERDKEDEALMLLNPEVYDQKGTQLLRLKIRRTKEYIDKYGIPSESDWRVEYDTLHPMVKMEIIVIPLYKDPNRPANMNELTLKLGFDYTGLYSPDSLLSYYDVGYRPISAQRQ